MFLLQTKSEIVWRLRHRRWIVRKWHENEGWGGVLEHWGYFARCNDQIQKRLSQAWLALNKNLTRATLVNPFCQNIFKFNLPVLIMNMFEAQYLAIFLWFMLRASLIVWRQSLRLRIVIQTAGVYHRQCQNHVVSTHVPFVAILHGLMFLVIWHYLWGKSKDLWNPTAVLPCRKFLFGLHGHRSLLSYNLSVTQNCQVIQTYVTDNLY